MVETLLLNNNFNMSWVGFKFNALLTIAHHSIQNLQFLAVINFRAYDFSFDLEYICKYMLSC